MQLLVTCINHGILGWWYIAVGLFHDGEEPHSRNYGPEKNMKVLIKSWKSPEYSLEIFVTTMPEISLSVRSAGDMIEVFKATRSIYDTDTSKSLFDLEQNSVNSIGYDRLINKNVVGWIFRAFTYQVVCQWNHLPEWVVVNALRRLHVMRNTLALNVQGPNYYSS